MCLCLSVCLLCVFFSVFSVSNLHACVHVCVCLRMCLDCHTESGWQVVAPHPSEHQALTLLHRNTLKSLSPALSLWADTLSHTGIPHPPCAMWGALLVALSTAVVALVISRQCLLVCELCSHTKTDPSS